MLALNQQLVPIVGFLVDTIEILSVLDRHELRDGALLKDLLTPLSHLLIKHFLLVSVKNANVLLTFLVLQALSFQDISCLIELIVFSTLVRHSAIGLGSSL